MAKSEFSCSENIVHELSLIHIWSCTSRPSRLQAEAKEKRVRVELSRKRLMPRPDSKILVEMLFSRM